MTQTELNALMAELAETLRERGIPVSREIEPEVHINTRAKRQLGLCIRKAGRYTIDVSEFLLERDEELRNTLCHELLHTCPDCMDHGAQWKYYAALAGEALGMEIARQAPPEEDEQPLRREPVKYVLECRNCGKRFLRRRMCRLVRYPSHYRCQCGGKLKRIC